MAENNNGSKFLKQMIIRWYLKKPKSLKKNISLESRRTTVQLPKWIKKKAENSFY